MLEKEIDWRIYKWKTIRFTALSATYQAVFITERIRNALQARLTLQTADALAQTAVHRPNARPLSPEAANCYASNIAPFAKTAEGALLCFSLRRGSCRYNQAYLPLQRRRQI